MQLRTTNYPQAPENIDSRSLSGFQLTEKEVVFLEGHDIHCVPHAWKVIEVAQKAKETDDYNVRNKKVNEPKHLTPELSMLAGVCQKVTLDDYAKDRFLQLYESCFRRGLFDKTKANPARLNPYK